MKLDFKPYVRLALYHTWLYGYVADRSIFDSEFIFIDKGTMKLEIHGEKYILKEGDVVYIPPNVHHKITWYKENCNQPHFHFDFFEDDLSKQISVSMKRKEDMSEEEKTHFREDYFKKNNIYIPTITHTKNPNTYRELIFKIISKYSSKDPLKELALEGLVKEFIAAIISENMNFQENELAGTLETIKFYMIENVRSNLTLLDMELRSGVTSWTLNHLFNEETGMSPKKYYDSLRVHYVKNLLLHSTISIKEIASLMNFDTPQTLSRWFHRLTKRYPSEYRRVKKAKRKG